MLQRQADTWNARRIDDGADTPDTPHSFREDRPRGPIGDIDRRPWAVIANRRFRGAFARLRARDDSVRSTSPLPRCQQEAAAAAPPFRDIKAEARQSAESFPVTTTRGRRGFRRRCDGSFWPAGHPCRTPLIEIVSGPRRGTPLSPPSSGQSEQAGVRAKPRARNGVQPRIVSPARTRQQRQHEARPVLRPWPQDRTGFTRSALRATVSRRIVLGGKCTPLDDGVGSWTTISSPGGLQDRPRRRQD